jgi:putative sterol carrier protein
VSEIADVFQKLPKLFQKGSVQTGRTFSFSLDDEEDWTVSLSRDACVVKQGKADDADCYVRSSRQLFLDVWNGKHTPSVGDFVTGRIKSNNPLLLKEFVAAFRK